jgi:putative hydrolase of the HAD superfamily
MRFKAVIFDLFGTLVDNFSYQEHRDMLSEMADAVSIPSHEFIKLWIETFRERVTGVFATPESNILYICDKIGVSPEDGQIKRAISIRREFTRGSLTPRSDARDTILTLKEMGLKIGLVSDCTYEVPTLWDQSAFLDLIDFPVFSCSAGIKKPDSRIYKLALEGLGVDPKDCLYVGDGSSHELTGAKRIGMHPVLIQVPYEDETAYKVDPEEWKGTRIGSLSEILELLK